MIIFIVPVFSHIFQSLEDFPNLGRNIACFACLFFCFIIYLKAAS